MEKSPPAGGYIMSAKVGKCVWLGRREKERTSPSRVLWPLLGLGSFSGEEWQPLRVLR